MYFHTGVDGFDYQFVGTAFLFKIGSRKFFVFTEHQYNIAEGADIFVSIPNRHDRGVLLPESAIFRFSDWDIAICELTDKELLQTLEAVPASLTKTFRAQDEFLYAITGYRQVHNQVNFKDKLILPDKGSIITAMVDMDQLSLKLDISTNIAIVEREEGDIKMLSMEAKTQGLSGSPVFGFKFGAQDVPSDHHQMELEFLGVVTHVAEKTGIVYASHSMDLLSCLDSAFGIFDEQRGHEAELADQNKPHPLDQDNLA